jgi:hypothetical protein
MAHSAPEPVKKALFNALVVPVLTYAALTYPFTGSVLLRIHVQANKLLRHCLGHAIRFESLSVLAPSSVDDDVLSTAKRHVSRWHHSGRSYPLLDGLPLSFECLMYDIATAGVEVPYSPYPPPATYNLYRTVRRLYNRIRDVPDHVHTEELYSHFMFVPITMVQQLLSHFGHWSRRAYDQATVLPHPLVSTLCGTVSARPLRSPRPHPPSRALCAASGLDKLSLLEFPVSHPNLGRDSWKALVRHRTKLFAVDFAECVVAPRRLLDGRPGPNWRALAEKWLGRGPRMV